MNEPSRVFVAREGDRADRLADLLLRADAEGVRPSALVVTCISCVLLGALPTE
jgi:hypothetical protein